MRTRAILISGLSFPLAGFAADIEATFNDLNVGAPQTDLVGGANEANTNTGTGFSDAGWDNPTTVLEILSGDLAIPGTVANYTANAEGGAGRRMGVINDTVARAGQLRSFTPLTGNTLWFSFLVRLDGTDAESHVVFNVNNNNNSGGAGGGFGVICGDNNIPGCLGLVTDTSAFIGSGTPPAGIQLYNPGGGTSNVLNTAGGTQLILGRLDVNDTGTDTLSIWLDPADAISPGAPTLSTTGEFVDAGGVANVSCEFVRRTANAGASIDHLRLSDSNTGQFFVTGMIDPDFSIDPSGAADLVFGNLFSGSGTRTLTYRVDSTLGNTVTVDSISLVDDGDGSFSIDSVTPSLPAVLADGDTLDLEVTAANAQPGTYTGVIQVDTTTTGLLGADAYDTALPLSAGIFVNGQVLNTNPYMDANLGGWGGGSSFVEGGIAPGSVGMARVKGLGDPAGGNPDALFQTAIVDGAEDWTMICYFTPIDIANFASYVDPDGTNGITGPDGAFTDRTFQWVLLGADASSPTPTFGDTEAADAIINLAYLPDGISTGGTPDFYVYDGSSWVATGIGAIQGSVDNDTDGDPLNGFGDGLLDTAVDPADSINVYKLTVSGTGFGTGSASYDLQIDKISGGDSFTTGNATGLSAFHSLSGNTTAPAAHAFITSDETSSSAFDAPYATSFWVDDAAFVNGTPADPSLTFLSVPTTALAFDPDTTGISTFRVRNDGSSNPLVINAPTFASPALGVTPPASIAPGAFADIPVSFDSLVGGSATEEFATLTSNASLNGSAEFLFNGATVGFSQLVPNFDFEVPGTDAAGDTNTFATWDEAVDAGSLADTDPAASRDVPGLIAGSATACYLDSSVGVPNIGNAFAVGVTDFVMEFPFAVKNTTGRQMALLLLGDTPVGKINLRYQGGEISAFSGGWQPLVTVALSPSEDADDNGSLDDIGDTKNVYKLRITGTGFGTAPSYSVEVLDLSNTVLGSTASPVSIFQDEFGAGVRAGEIIFSSEFGNNPGWWVDDVSLSGAIVTDPNIVISAISKSGGTVTMDFTSAVNVDVYKSTDLTTFGASPILSDVAPGTGVTVDASATEPSAFYVLVPTGDPAP